MDILDSRSDMQKARAIRRINSHSSYRYHLGGVCIMESKESITSWKLLRKGIPITGIAVREAIIPGRCAEPFPAAITTSTPWPSRCCTYLSVFG